VLDETKTCIEHVMAEHMAAGQNMAKSYSSAGPCGRMLHAEVLDTKFTKCHQPVRGSGNQASDPRVYFGLMGLGFRVEPHTLSPVSVQRWYPPPCVALPVCSLGRSVSVCFSSGPRVWWMLRRP
jgi:hypothetical protein